VPALPPVATVGVLVAALAAVTAPPPADHRRRHPAPVPAERLALGAAR
jgi:hypothetical protein